MVPNDVARVLAVAQKRLSEGAEVSAADEAENSSEHRYEIINERMTWTEAEAYCEAEGGHLATVGSEEEYAQILEAAGITSRQVL